MQGEIEKTELVVEVKFDPATKNVLAERFYSEGALHRLGDLPAVIKYDPETGIPIEHAFYKSGKLHRIGKPAWLEFDPVSGVTTRESYAVNGMIHRDGDYPATILRHHKTGRKLSETYAVENLWHRKNGPAKIHYNPDTGAVTERVYFNRGRQRAAKPKPLRFD